MQGDEGPNPGDPDVKSGNGTPVSGTPRATPKSGGSGPKAPWEGVPSPGNSSPFAGNSTAFGRTLAARGGSRRGDATPMSVTTPVRFLGRCVLPAWARHGCLSGLRGQRAVIDCYFSSARVKAAQGGAGVRSAASLHHAPQQARSISITAHKHALCVHATLIKHALWVLACGPNRALQAAQLAVERSLVTSLRLCRAVQRPSSQR